MRFADCRKLKIFHSPLKDLNALHNPPAAGNSRTRRPGAGLSAQAALSPAMQPVVRRPPAKRFALPLFSPSLTRPRGCAGQDAHRVCACAQPRTHAVASGCAPALSFCFPKQGESPAHVPCAREETRRAKAPAHPPRTETLEKAELCSLAFQARLRRARRAPCLFLPRVSHARGWFRVQAHARLLFSRAGRKPVSCSLWPGKSPRQTSMNM